MSPCCIKYHFVLGSRGHCRDDIRSESGCQGTNYPPLEPHYFGLPHALPVHAFTGILSVDSVIVVGSE
jgi:hypothetical protein